MTLGDFSATPGRALREFWKIMEPGLLGCWSLGPGVGTIWCLIWLSPVRHSSADAFLHDLRLVN